MRGMDVTESAPGRLVPYGRRPYYDPEPLPPEGIDFDIGFYNDLLAETTLWLGKLSGISLVAEFPPVLYTSLLRKEAMESVEIEGGDVDFNALYRTETHSRAIERPDEASDDAEPLYTRDTQEVLNYEDAIEAGIEAVDRGERISMALLNSLHATLLDDIRSETDTIGEFRTDPVHLGRYVPPASDTVDRAMDALFGYVRAGGTKFYHDLVDIALVHYQLETIHPYGDGNGRLGRLLVTLQLYESGYLERPNLYLSEYFNRNKQAYVDRMQAVRQRGEWSDWVEFFLRGIRHQAEESVERTLELRDLYAKYDAEFGDRKRADARLALVLFDRPYVTARDAASMLDVSNQTAYRAISRLEDAGVLEEVTGKDYGREYRAAEVFEILERPPQTY